ncbi:hypothetical protein PRUPE_5G239400 [Prunus persica]|uniref:NADP-dependent oxidoreductase domain-containing protein n=1 Tax=Prunus persica TaxID=3760 RepID=A0A251PD07_PRUPE|nr:hypothetical protein PRUPE_5G239400 [Prunus persica]
MDAIEVGYHHFDTAAFYQSEQAIGRVVVQALDLIKSRDEIFITSKLWCTDASQSYSRCPQHHTQVSTKYHSLSTTITYYIFRAYQHLCICLCFVYSTFESLFRRLN